MLSAVGSLVKVCFRTLEGMIVRKTNQAKTRMANQGAGFSWGMSLGVVGRHQSLA